MSLMMKTLDRVKRGLAKTPGMLEFIEEERANLHAAELAAKDAEIERLQGLSPDNMPKNEKEWWIALKAQNAELEKLRADNDRLRADSEQLNKLTIEFNTVTKAADAEIERLRGLYDSATDQAVRYADDNERLNAIKQAAEKAYRYHILGYKDAEAFNANVMLDLMNELGELL